MKKTFAITVLLAAFSLCVSAPASAGGDAGAAGRKKILVMPVLNSAFERKDKFYGLNEDLSRNLQAFFTFALDMFSDYDAVRPDAARLYEAYPAAGVFPNKGETPAERLDAETLMKAGGEYGADIVLAARVTKAAVLVDKRNNTLSVEVEFIAIDAESKEIIYDKTLTGEDTFEYSEWKNKEEAGSIGALSISGKPLSHAELADSPMKFGGMVTGFPFLVLARQLAADFRE